MCRVEVIEGNKACAMGAIAAGCRFFAGYPITPATEIAEEMARLLPQARGYCVQMEDELASINAVIGASWGGLKAMTATSGPGFSLMQEGIGYAVETETPCVVVNVQRGGPATGQPTRASQQDVMQARFGSHGDYEVITLAPYSAQEAFDLTVRAFNLSERFRVPVILLMDEIVGHTREKVRLPHQVETVERPSPAGPPAPGYPHYAPGPDLVPRPANFGRGYAVLVDGQLHDEKGNRVGHLPSESEKLVKRLCDKILANQHEIEMTQCEDVGDAELLVLSWGSTSRPARQAAREARAMGIRAGWARLVTVWPFPDETVKSWLEQVKAVVVPEMNLGKVVREVRRVAPRGVYVAGVPFLGGVLPAPERILEEIRRVV